MQRRPGFKEKVGEMVMEKDTKVVLSGWELDNPIIPASGTFSYGYEFQEFYDINKLGSFSFKGTTRYPQKGNPLPRVAEYDSGLINSVGLENPGIHKVIEEELPKIKEVFHMYAQMTAGAFSFTRRNGFGRIKIVYYSESRHFNDMKRYEKEVVQ